MAPQESAARNLAQPSDDRTLRATRRHAAWLLVAFLVAILIFAMRSLVERIDHLSNASRESAWIGASRAISLFVHELQRERGLSSAFSASDGNFFDEGLNAQQARTDFSLAELELKLSELAVDPAAAANSFPEPNDFQAAMREMDVDPATRQHLEERLARLPELRRQIREQVISREFAADAYTALVDAFFDVQMGAFGIAVESSIYRQQMALLAFTQAKERAGQERALLSAMLADRKFTPDRLSKWNGIKAAEEAETVNFLRLADRDVRTRFDAILSEPHVRQADRLRQKVRAMALHGIFYGTDSQDTDNAPALPHSEESSRAKRNPILSHSRQDWPMG